LLGCFSPDPAFRRPAFFYTTGHPVDRGMIFGSCMVVDDGIAASSPGAPDLEDFGSLNGCCFYFRIHISQNIMFYYVFYM